MTSISVNQTPPCGGEYDVAIAGGGMVGMTLAIALAREGLEVALVEKATLPAQLEAGFDGRVSAIALGSKYLLENIGVWQGMQAEAQPIWDIRVSDGHAPVCLHYDHREISGEPFGYIVENRYIRQALHGAAREMKNITLIENATVEGFENDAGCQMLDVKINAASDIPHPASGAQRLRCRLLIGAEGRQSPVRRQAGIGTVEWNYRQTAIVCTIEHEHPHGGLAQERFLPAGPFAVLPMTGNRSSLVWVEPDDRVRTYLDLPDDELAQEISERAGDYLGRITVSGKRFSYKLSLIHAKTYIGERLALAGDAAHAIHPIAGQGVNLGFRDAAVLAELLGETRRRGLDVGAPDVLEHYQRWRRFDNTAMLAMTDGLNRLFSSNVAPLRLVRDMGLWAVGNMPALKRFFMRHAMGLEGDVPELMRRRGHEAGHPSLEEGQVILKASREG